MKSFKLNVNKKIYETDERGYLQDFSKWSEEVALAIAKTEGIELTDTHWKVIYYLRNLTGYKRQLPHNHTLRGWQVKKVLSWKERRKAKFRNLYLRNVFPKLVKQACKIAGLKEPECCCYDN
jgi:tRNA 2-thiouridine synthesizing protein E